VNGQKIGLEFDGCRFHPNENFTTETLNCPCGTKFIGTVEEAEKKALRTRIIKSELDVYIVMKECVYRKQIDRDCPQLLSKVLFKDVTSDLIIEKIKTGDLYGFAMVNINCPDEAKKPFLDLNFPPIYKHIVITEDLIGKFCGLCKPHEIFYLGEKMQEVVRNKNVKLPMDPQLGLVFNADNIILTSSMIKWYLEHGLVISKIHYFVEYFPEKCFNNFVDLCVKMRMQGDMEKKPNEEVSAKSQLAKTIMNSSWGRLCMRMDKRFNTIFIRSSQLSTHERDFLFREKFELFSEYPIDLFEVQKNRRSIKDSVPTHVSLFILQEAKLRMLEFLFVLYNFLRPGSFRLCYTDTDSYIFALEDDIDKLVVENKKGEWLKVKPDWFVVDDSLEQKRRPGLIKSEFRSLHGSFVGVCPKAYIVQEENSKRERTEKKYSSKGVSKHADLEKQIFLKAIYEPNQTERGTFSQFKFDRTTTTMQTIEQNKRLLNSLYTKLFVEADLISISPLSKEGEYL